MKTPNASLCVLAIACVSAGCANQQVKPIDVNSISQVQAEIKRQIGIYLAAAVNLPRLDAPSDGTPASGAVVFIDEKPKRIAASEFQCGTGAIDFDISSIKAELTTTLTTTTTVKLGLTLPIVPVTIAPSGGQSNSNANSQTLDYGLWPLSPANQDPQLTSSMPDMKTIQGAPIALALLDLRNGLILSGTLKDYATGKQRPPQPCFTDYDPSNPTKDAGDVFKVALTVTSDSTGGLSVGVAPLSFSATGETKATTGNTLSVAFVQRDLKEIQWLRDVNSEACKYPNDSTTFLCEISTGSLNLVLAAHSRRGDRDETLKMRFAEYCGPISDKLKNTDESKWTSAEKTEYANCKKAAQMISRAEKATDVGTGQFMF